MYKRLLYRKNWLFVFFLFLARSFVATFLVVFLVVGSVSLSYAKDNLNINSLDKIKIKVKEAEENLEDLDIEIKNLTAQINKSNEELRKIKNEKDLTTKTRMRNEAELKSLEESIEKLRKEAVVLVNRSKGRLRALYRERPIQDLLSFLFSDKSNNGSRVAFYVSKIRKYDKKLMVRLLAIRQDFAIKANKQREILANNIELENKLIRMHNEEQAQIAKKKETLALLTRKEKQVEKELNELRVQALRIEIVLKSVTTGKELLLETKDIKKKDKEKKDKEKDKDKLKRKIVKPFTGKGLLALKGKLPFPVKGKIVKTFGKHQVKKFKDFVITKGIEFAVANGTQAHAVAKGKVIFDGKMPGYGSMIILDHGERYYTIYSHLINIGAKLGDVLDAGDLVGECDVKEQNNNFYFEIRKDGKPVDPKLYLAS